MSLFEFQLTPVEQVEPWGTPPAQSLSWFALTWGAFRISVGSDFLFRYTPELLAHWGEDPASPDATYQVAAFARNSLGCLDAAIAPMPELFERVASDRDLRSRLLRLTNELAAGSDEHQERAYQAWRWLGERSPCMSYLVAPPRFAFLRVGDNVHVAWDNSDTTIDGIKVWTADCGRLALPVHAFVAECRSFADRLLTAMEMRLTAIASREAHPRVEVDVGALREEHGTWARELGGYFGGYTPDVEWRHAESALRKIAAGGDIPLLTAAEFQLTPARPEAGRGESARRPPRKVGGRSHPQTTKPSDLPTFRPSFSILSERLQMEA